MALTPPNPQTAATVAPQQVRAMLKDGGEMALLDVREEGVFSEQGHPFFANSVPLSRLELMIRDLVPRKLTRIVVYDAGPGASDGTNLADRTAAKLASTGYDNVAVMAGGAPAWAASGYELFTGVNVPSKAFGEAVEHPPRTPPLPPSQLKQRLHAGRKGLLLDNPPNGEIRKNRNPRAFDC